MQWRPKPDNEIDPGILRHRITLQANTETVSAEGEPLSVWADAATVWACIGSAGGNEQLAADQITATVLMEIIIRYRRGVTAAMRVKFSDPKERTDRYFQILAVENPDERRFMLILHCKEIVGLAVDK